MDSTDLETTAKPPQGLFDRMNRMFRMGKGNPARMAGLRQSCKSCSSCPPHSRPFAPFAALPILRILFMGRGSGTGLTGWTGWERSPSLSSSCKSCSSCLPLRGCPVFHPWMPLLPSPLRFTFHVLRSTSLHPVFPLRVHLFLIRVYQCSSVASPSDGSKSHLTFQAMFSIFSPPNLYMMLLSRWLRKEPSHEPSR